MVAGNWLTLATCGGQLALLLWVLAKGRGPLLVPLAGVSGVLFAWNFATLAYDLSGQKAWHFADVAISPLSAPLAFHFIVAFVGLRRPLRGALIASYAAFGALSFVSSLAFVSTSFEDFGGSSNWATLFLVGLCPLVVVGAALLFRHLREADGDERARTALVLAAMSLIAACGASELGALVGLPVPPVASVGALVFNALLALVTIRWRLLPQELTTRLAYVAALVAAAWTAASFGVVAFGKAGVAIGALGLAALTLALLLVTRALTRQAAAKRERVSQLATLGRLSSQLAHDLKNPLAALKGAAQYLREEVAQGTALADQGQFLDLIVAQVDRLQGVLDDYKRLGRLEPLKSPLDLNALVKNLLALQPFAAENVKLASALDPTLPTLSADKDLLGAALDNLLRNAAEAMPAGGTVAVNTSREEDGAGLLAVVSVEDSGVGMDRRTLERAFDEFYTTKAQGSGLGLAFVRRVAEAHGGLVTVRSTPGRGTTVMLKLPCA